MSDRTANRMKSTWDTLARRNAMHFIATERVDWDVSSFLASGKDTVHTLFASVGEFPVQSSGTALEVGCGIGRISFTVAGLFERVIGVDISEEMIVKANELKQELGMRNVEFLRNNGRDLRDIPDGSCDLVLSFFMLQHVPDKQVVLSYISEFGRVAKPDGHVLFQVPVYRKNPLVLPWRLFQYLFRNMLWKLEDRGLVSPETGVAFRGTRLQAKEIERLLYASDLRMLKMRRMKTTYRFCDDALYYCRKLMPS